MWVRKKKWGGVPSTSVRLIVWSGQWAESYPPPLYKVRGYGGVLPSNSPPSLRAGYSFNFTYQHWVFQYHGFWSGLYICHERLGLRHESPQYIQIFFITDKIHYNIICLFHEYTLYLFFKYRWYIILFNPHLIFSEIIWLCIASFKKHSIFLFIWLARKELNPRHIECCRYFFFFPE